MNKPFRFYTSLLSLSVFMLLVSSCITIGIGREKQKWNKTDIEIDEDNESVTTERNVQAFTGINASTGVRVIVSQAEGTKVEVRADKALQQMVHTDVVDGILKVYFERHSSRSGVTIYPHSNVIVYVKTPELTSLESSAGARVKIDELFKTNEISVGASSGSVISAALDAKKISASAGSGAVVSLSGTALYLDVSSLSGSVLKTGDLKADVCMLHVSSGSVCKVSSVKEIHGYVSSGGVVTDYGSAKVEDVKVFSGGLFRHREKD